MHLHLLHKGRLSSGALSAIQIVATTLTTAPNSNLLLALCSPSALPSTQLTHCLRLLQGNGDSLTKSRSHPKDPALTVAYYIISMTATAHMDHGVSRFTCVPIVKQMVTLYLAAQASQPTHNLNAGRHVSKFTYVPLHMYYEQVAIHFCCMYRACVHH